MSRDIDYTPGLRTGGVLFFRLVAAGGIDGEVCEDLTVAVFDGGDVVDEQDEHCVTIATSRNCQDGILELLERVPSKVDLDPILTTF